ncbi:DUF5018 domain-containing protein [Flavobacterium sp. Fl-318]|uniref:DUF5018 domain-containing protein n=1 Tax=Flavobacterium cupriresistens TaxID=2893885 RepID=A0ABU4RA18_9FLAO|nr:MULTISPECIES: DUF5018 domain-containing protein [unclassified Flavobacterium]MDX6189409.1 DUF5018 domain-containing protein [Flavobacterium sp. Fl-318]UFH41503.1 DUF5018 domain-containing protein [Flavobacterium sp. F-323]
MKTKVDHFKGVLFLMSFTLLALLTACDNEEERWTDVKGETKTEIITDLDARRIVSFRITNPGEAQAIHSAVNNLEKTITVYLPAYYEYQYLEVAVTLPSKTTISPATTELLPVFSKEPVTYTTKAADGTTAVYTVKIVIQQPKLIVEEVSDGSPDFTINTNTSVTVLGENFLPSYQVTKLFVVDAQGNKKWQMKQYNDGVDIGSYYAWYVFFDDLNNLPTLQPNTDYWFMMESYQTTKTMKLPFRITN